MDKKKVSKFSIEGAMINSLEIMKKRQDEYQKITQSIISPAFLESIKRWQVVFAKIRLPLEHIQNTAKVFSDFLDSALKPMLEPEYLKFYEEYGWLDWMAWDVFLEFYYRYKNGDSTFLEDLSKELREDGAVEWVSSELFESQIFTRRKRYLDRILSLHHDGDYLSSIPLAFIQIEGAVRDMAVLKGVLENKLNPEYLITNGVYEIDVKGNPIKATFGELVKRIFVEKEKLVGGEVKAPTPKALKEKIYTKDRRHSILHGTQLDYEDENLSSYLILILIALSKKALKIEKASRITPYWT